MSLHKKRLDKILKARYPDISRSKIQELIAQGAVSHNGIIMNQVSQLINEDSVLDVDVSHMRYVSRAGIKLEHALKDFGITIHDKICLDAGLSTGGFTDCLLQQGAQKVYGVDVGTAQVDARIKNDPRVVVMENTDIRAVPQLDAVIDLITLDLSFISLTKVIHAVVPLLKKGGELITLIKPQFEVGLEIAHKFQGVIKDATIQQDVVKSLVHEIQQAGFVLKNIVESPLLGGSGNKEFLAYFVKKD